MSCCAVIATNDSTVLLSDGMSIDVSGVDPDNIQITPDRIKSTNQPKIKKITPQTGVVWMGNHADEWHRFESSGSPGEIANDLRDFADSIVNRKLIGEKWFMVNAHVLGYHNGELEYYQIVLKGDQIVCLQHPIKIPWIFVKNPLIDNSTATRKFAEHLGKNPQVETAFKNLLDEIGQGILGGTIFTEQIQNNGHI